MPASETVVFDAFHYHHWRARWDSLVGITRISGGAACPSVGAVSENVGSGVLRWLSMRTQFVTYDRPRVAAAAMVGRSFPFTRWAASMRHQATGPNKSLLIYTYTLEVGPPALRWLIAPVVVLLFNWQTRKRFARLRNFLELHAEDVKLWHQGQTDDVSGVITLHV